SGAVAVALKHEAPFLEVWASDISAEALEVAEANAARLLADTPLRFLRGDLFEPVGPAFTCIVGNPPYIPSGEIGGLAPEVRKEPRLALDGGEDGLRILRRIIAGAPDHLCPGGTLLVEADPRQMAELASLLETGGYEDIKIHRDLSGAERVIGGTRPGRHEQYKHG
ncbi:MAG: peptide chain release factor N(5)-glutamine methyltransferase, partial [Treponema sp.]|nr:peptide chain release factor N(5)-glutamine methyltransferase [Treponema sp.]